MKLIKLVDRSKNEYWINLDQICGIEELMPIGPKAERGSKMRINGFSRALQFNESPEELERRIRGHQVLGGNVVVHNPRTPPPPVSVRELDARGIVGYRHDRKAL